MFEINLDARWHMIVGISYITLVKTTKPRFGLETLPLLSVIMEQLTFSSSSSLIFNQNTSCNTTCPRTEILHTLHHSFLEYCNIPKGKNTPKLKRDPGNEVAWAWDGNCLTAYSAVTFFHFSSLLSWNSVKQPGLWNDLFDLHTAVK